MLNKKFALSLATAIACVSGSAFALTNPFTETFNTNASNWLTGASTAPVYNATGGIGNTGYISFTTNFTSGSSGPFGAPPLQILFRGNDAANASGDAFVGNWITGGVISLSIAVRHNYSSTLNLYSRFDAGAGAAASLTFDPLYAVAPNTWTTITIPITNSNPPFLSYGAGTFNSVFSSVANVQFGLYVPASTTFTGLTMDIDNVSVVPEPTSAALLAMGGMSALLLRRRRGVR